MKVSYDNSIYFKITEVHVTISLGYFQLINMPLWTPGDNQFACLSQR